MPETENLLNTEIAQWIISKIQSLQARSKYCAQNAVKFLNWADEILDTSPIVSSFCALHATEEAVASFISAAKDHGHKKYAKEINIHDHLSKALVSIFTQRLSQVADQGGLAVAVKEDRSCLAYRVSQGGNLSYGDLHLNMFRIHDGKIPDADGHILLGDAPPLQELDDEVKKVADARNKLLYASKTGLPTGFIDPVNSLNREIKLTLGLIWAAVDLREFPNQDAPFVTEILRQMVSINSNRKKCKPVY